MKARTAAELGGQLAAAMRTALADEAAALAPTVRSTRQRLRGFLDQERYLASSELRAWLERLIPAETEAISRLGQILTHRYWTDADHADLREAQAEVAGFLQDPARRLNDRNEAFIARETERRSSFFDAIEKDPLTAEQRRATIVLDDHNLLIAAAGSGKTSVIVAKAAYAIELGLCRPEEILVVAFNREVRKELEARLARRIPQGGGAVNVRTFHALGLEIIGKATGRRPDVPDWVIDEGATGTRVLEEIISGVAASDVGFELDWILFRTLVNAPDTDLTEFRSEDQYRQYLRRIGEAWRERAGIRTLNGELVKSIQEAAIANWLYLHAIDYEYERAYIYVTADSLHRQYHPDFYYPAIDLWHEHFALDASGRPPALWADKYGEGVAWKRHLHSERSSALIETTSAMYRDGSLLPYLEQQLRDRGLTPARRSPAEVDQRLRELKVDTATTFVRTFLRHWKSNSVEPQELAARAARLPDRLRAQLMLRVMVPIREAYDHRLQAAGEIDFEDMVNLAANYVAGGRFRNPYRLILVDEFQDISVARARLIRSLHEQRPDSRLFAVGDDWQSIYRFAGSDISLMTGFARNFGPTARNYLTHTFRSNQGLCDVAGRFVQVNPAQERKQVKAKDQRTEAVVKILLHRDTATRSRASKRGWRRSRRWRETRVPRRPSTSWPDTTTSGPIGSQPGSHSSEAR